MINASISFQVLPLGLKENDAVKIIDKVIKMVQKSGINYHVGPMETTMEGDLEKMLDIIKNSQKLCTKSGAKTIFTNVKIIYNPKGILSVKQKLSKYNK
jgi:uncharacterized protein YqgV (UPF0045/DUF77 family)